jgi:molybdenum transport protein
VLVFPEHLAFLAREPLPALVVRLRQTAPEKKLVIEVKDLATALAAADAGFDVIQTEKFAPVDIAALVQQLRVAPTRPVIAAAGGINGENAMAYAAAGAAGFRP